MMRWGIVPWFAKSDRLTDSKMWREPFAKRRCLVPASGLYEWPKEGHAISPTYTPEPAPNEGSTGPSGTKDYFRFAFQLYIIRLV
jgi:hypothetical protein